MDRETLIEECRRAATACGDPDEHLFDIEQAAYWLASDFHGGQNTDLYEALCASPYKPGLLESGPEPCLPAAYIYELVATEHLEHQNT